ncbi:MAG: helicase RepA family protein [Actinomycetota bacterium]|nr:helicase RepA family protein [Actinomycetota bacterium]
MQRLDVETVARANGWPGDGEKAEEILSVHPRGEEEKRESSLRFYSAREIGELASPDIDWIARPWIAAGSLTELDGKIKNAGKSTFVTHLCRAVLEGEQFMGQPTTATPIVYLSEQPTASFRETLRRADLLDRDDFRVLRFGDVFGLDWPVVVEGAIAEALRIGARLLVVDTLAQFSGLQGEGENSAGDALTAIAPLQQAATLHGLAVAIVRHSRKGGGEVGESARGSSAFGGAVDVLLSLRRRDGHAPSTQRVIYSLSRFDETPPDLVIDLTDEGYIPLGSIDAATGEALQEQVQTLLDGQRLTVDEILERIEGTNRSAITKALEKDPDISKGGRGVRGDPYYYWTGDLPSLEGDFLSIQPPLLDEKKETGGLGEAA